MGVENEINAISAFNQVVVEVEAELGNKLILRFIIAVLVQGKSSSSDVLLQLLGVFYQF